MKHPFFTAILVAAAAFSLQPTHAEPAFSVTSPIIYDTGDSWSQQGRHYRLYGVQACIRGTAFVSASGAKGDCGAASVTMLAGLFESLKVNCTPVAPGPDGSTIVICAGVSNDRPLDIGGAMISAGFAFAAEKPDGAPVNLAYFASEIRAKNDRAGLWGAASFTHPVQMLRVLARQARTQP
ncbi:MAG: thermonuclease family protein [Beijerinckiaceae bacterium]